MSAQVPPRTPPICNHRTGRLEVALRTAEKLTETLTGDPATVTVPFPGFGVNRLGELVETQNEKLPFMDRKFIDGFVEMSVEFSNCTDHVMPAGSPDSLKLTLNVYATQRIDIVSGLPSTEARPPNGIDTKCQPSTEPIRKV